MGTPTTFIKLDRNILSWGWFSTPATLSVWLFILIKANISDRKFQGVPVRRGELVTSYNSIAEACGISVDKVRTAIKHLVDTGEIEKKGYNKFLHISVINYNTYQNTNVDEKYMPSHSNPTVQTAIHSHSENITDSNFPFKSHTDTIQNTTRTQSNPNTIRNKEIKNERSECVRHAHGIFNNIFLTDEEYKDYKLRLRDIDTVIDELSEALAANPEKYGHGDIKAWLNKFIRQKYGKLPERRKLLNELH